MMKVSQERLGDIVEEIRAVEERWNDAQTPQEKLYYFSAIFGTINRVMNFECDPVLVFIHHMLQTTHQAVVSRLNSPKPPGQEVFLGVPDDMIDGLLPVAKDLQTALAQYAGGTNADQLIWDLGIKLSNIAYAMSGNGFYLHLRGKLKL